MKQYIVLIYRMMSAIISSKEKEITKMKNDFIIHFWVNQNKGITNINL